MLKDEETFVDKIVSIDQSKIEPGPPYGIKFMMRYLAKQPFNVRVEMPMGIKPKRF